MRIAGTLRSAYEHLAFWTVYACFGICGVAVTLVSVVLHPLLPRATGVRFGKHMIAFLFRAFLRTLEVGRLARLDLSALDRLRDEPSLIIAPNHPSLLDAVLVISRVPQVGCIMKAAIWDNPVLGGGARLAGYIRNDNPMAMVRQATREVRRGQSLLVFPEGTRTRSYPVNHFKGGFALVATRAKAPVQTVFIECNSPFLGKSWPLFRKPMFPVTYRARLGKRFMVGDDVQRFLCDLEAYYRIELAGRTQFGCNPDEAEEYQRAEGSSA